MDDRINDLTIADVEVRLAEIRLGVNGDWEAAHSAEDALYMNVLRTIAAGRNDREDAAALAAFALQSRNIDFPRYCA